MRERIIIGPIAFFIFLAAGLTTMFHIVEFSSEAVQIALFLVLSIALMSLLRPELRLKSTIQEQGSVILAGLYGAVGLLLSQLIFLPFTYSSIQLALYAAIAEECFFSGFAYTGLRRVLPTVNWTIVAFILSLAFASMHAIAYSLTLTVFLILVIGRVILFVALEKTSDLGAPLLGHLIVNMLGSQIDYYIILDILRFSVPLIVILIVAWWCLKK